MKGNSFWMNKTKIKGILINGLMKLFQVFPKKNSAVFVSFDGKQYSCNPRAISEVLYNLDNAVDIIWIFKDINVDCPSYIKKVRKGSIRSLFEYSRAKVWVDNCNKPEYYYKSKKQLYIQTWHGDCGFKQLVDEQHICKFDVGVSSCKFSEKYVYEKAFHFTGKLYKYGSPRNDALINCDTEAIGRIKRCLNIPEDVKVLVFAPTFRDSRVGKSGRISMPFNESKIINALNSITGDRWLLIYRGHHVTSEKMVFNDHKVLDVSSYPDMTDLLRISDLLITDYSSCCCDFAVGNKPAVLYHWDKDAYTKKDRATVYTDQELPFEIAYTEDELIRVIDKVLKGDVNNYCNSIKQFFGSYESGHASNSVSLEIVRWIDVDGEEYSRKV